MKRNLIKPRMPGVSLNATQILRREDFQLHILSPGKIRSDLGHQDPSVTPNLNKRLSGFNNIPSMFYRPDKKINQTYFSDLFL